MNSSTAAPGTSTATGPLVSSPSPIHSPARHKACRAAGDPRSASRWRHRSSAVSASHRFSSASAVAARPMTSTPRLVATTVPAASAAASPQRGRANKATATAQPHAASTDGSRSANSPSPKTCTDSACSQ